MKGLWNRLRNGKALWSAYRNVSTLTGDDLANETIFTHLREFAAAPTGPVSLPAGLIREFNASQKRARGRKKFRFGVGALFATIVLFPSLAYAGALPTSVARVVQRIFNVVSVPIQIPSVATQSGQSDERGQTAPTSVQHGSDSESQTPGARQLRLRVRRRPRKPRKRATHLLSPNRPLQILFRLRSRLRLRHQMA